MDLRSSVGFQLWLGWRRLQAEQKSALEQGINLQRLYLMSLLTVGKGRTLSSLARALELDLPSVSGLVSRMEQAGWVERRRNPANRAEVPVFLTPLGQERRDVVARKVEALEARLGDPAALRALVDALS